MMLLITAGTMIGVPPSLAVVLSEGEGTGNANLAVVEATRHVGSLKSGTGTHIGGDWILTANHIGPGDINLEGTYYSYFEGSAIRLETSPGEPADLLMFRVYPPPNLPALAIRSEPPAVGDPLLMVGSGRDRGDAITYDPFGPGIDPPELHGWDWMPTSSLRWGLNTAEAIHPISIQGTTVFKTDFDEVDAILFESQGAAGDSGGGVFTYDPLRNVELAGIMIGTTIAFGQDPTSTLYTNETVVASLDVYADQIAQNIIDAPEPVGGLVVGVGMLSVLARMRRHRRCITSMPRHEIGVESA
jgi:hypothetical protein